MAELSENLLDELAIVAHYNCRQVASLCHLSVRQLQRKFNQLFHCSPQKWLDERRIRDAQGLLLLGLPVKAVALELGFKHVSHFCRQFKSQNKVTPREFVMLQSRARQDVAQV